MVKMCLVCIESERIRKQGGEGVGRIERQ